jgi:hypothetical protein
MDLVVFVSFGPTYLDPIDIEKDNVDFDIKVWCLKKKVPDNSGDRTRY